MSDTTHKTVLTLDAGGTNFVFSAIRDFEEVVTPVRLDAVTDNAVRCLETLVQGFREVEALLVLGVQTTGGGCIYSGL